ncbi:MAG: hypothetical protein Q4G07_07435 [Oscillospiraceae bacterium]|nr:hypothetical protein [Oscillospiraceae bacterium]
MSVPMIAGSAQAYARGVYTQAKAMLRVEKGLTPTEEKQRRDKSTIEAMMDPDRGKTMNIVSIQGKLDRGQKLSNKEMEWLRRNKPDLYKKAKEVQAEREQFERELKSCKTKDDVQRLRMRYSQKIYSEMKTAMKNGGDIITPKWKFLAVGDSYSQFTRTAEYKDLPTEVELRIEEEKEKEQEKKGHRKKTAKKDTLFLQMQENQKTFGIGSQNKEDEKTENVKKDGGAADAKRAEDSTNIVDGAAAAADAPDAAQSFSVSKAALPSSSEAQPQTAGFKSRA